MIDQEQDGYNNAGALHGLRVIEMGSYIAGPFCGQILADMGAEVIKIESIGKGDAMRSWGLLDPDGKSYWWRVIARNKKSIALNLRTSEGAEITRKLLREADVLIENFRPGTLEKWGLDPNDLIDANPELIVGRVSGFGQTGPYASRTGFGAIAEAMAGMRTLAGFPGEPPVRAGLSIGDSTAGLFTAIGILSALHKRNETKRGQIVDVGITDAVLGISESILAEFGATGAVRQRMGTILPRIAPSNIYPTSDEDWILIAGNGDEIFRRLALAMNQVDLASDPRFASHALRGENQSTLDDIIAQWTSKHSLEELLGLMEQHSVPAGPISDARDVAADQHFRDRESVIEVPEGNDAVLMQGVVPKLSENTGKVHSIGPKLGQHSELILKSYLGYDDDTIKQYSDQGVIQLTPGDGI